MGGDQKSLLPHPSFANQGQLGTSEPCAVTQGPTLRGVPNLLYSSAVSLLKFIVIFKQRATPFHFGQRSTNYVTSPVCNKDRVGFNLHLQIEERI